MAFNYGSAREVSNAVSALLAAPNRMLPADAIEKYAKLPTGPWDRSLAPMMVEPVNYLASREYTGITFVGPARGSKTFTLIEGGLTYVVLCAPGDIQITHITKDLARRFSKVDLTRLISHSPELAAQISPRPQDDNVFDKHFRSGMSLDVAWPTAGQQAGKTLRWAFLTDYDRMENRDDVDGEGTLWGLAKKRIQTYMSAGKIVCESSPGGEYDPRDWVPAGPHEAPPATGILAIYNEGTRARFYWPCLSCGEFFQASPGLELFNLPSFDELLQEIRRWDLLERAQSFAVIGCKHCGAAHRMDNKRELNLRGRWVHEGESIDAAGRVSGTRRNTDTVSYWLGGCSAAYQRWDSMIFEYLKGVLTFSQTGDEGPLKKTVNTDQAMPYLTRAVAKRRAANAFADRLEDYAPRGMVPEGVRYLVATIDVQAHRFVIEVHGFGIGHETWLIDRWTISGSQRVEHGGTFCAVQPASFVEDWLPLLPQVANKEFPLAENRDLCMHPVITFCDSGGEDGVTDKAYKFWRWVRDRGMGRRLMLVKGDGNPDKPQYQQTYPDARGRKDRQASAIGDVPVWLLNSNFFKDAIHADLEIMVPGPGYVHLPRWLEPEYFMELTAETRDPVKKTWAKISQNRPNEAWDLRYYARAASVILGADLIKWNEPERIPTWARGPQQRRKDFQRPPSRGRGVRSQGIE